ncbi:MAG: 16S rRNA (uracil(1498)-N(3))-methyltransferase [Candidatus Rokuibacteriota bacterium]|nr:MAG: 16S rRNA (uracil(1498)-N(3))-methyltransferase [Candidatus Rokubacteria bacterium]
MGSSRGPPAPWRAGPRSSSVRRFTIAPERLDGDRVVFDRDESHHLARVLRLRSGDTVIAADGAGREYTVRLETVGELTTGTVLGVTSRETESPLRITLLQSVPKGDKMEAIVRAAIELGVARVVPVLTARTIVTLEPGRWRDRARRWQRVAKEAAKQCGRAVVPPVDVPRPLADALALDEPADLRLCLWEGAVSDEPRGRQAGVPVATLAASLPADLPSGSRVHLLVGPEGGLSREEAQSACAHHWTIVGVGPRILRTETAGPAIIAVLQSRFGDLGTGR